MTRNDACRLDRILLFAGMIVTAVALDSPARGQDDPEDEPEIIVQPQPAFEMSDDNFDQWVFGGGRNAQTGRRRLESLLNLQVEDVDRTCGLTEDQKKKLTLAGRGDIRRFFVQVDEKRRKFQLVKRDQTKIGEVFQEIQPLQATLNSGLYNEQSFFSKAIRKTLTPEQSAKYEVALREKMLFKYKAKVDLAIATLDRSVGLRFEQRKQFAKLLMEETQPPKRFGQYDYYVILLQASNLPEAKIKPIFNEQQWRLLNRQFQNAKGLETFLKNGDFLPAGANDAPPPPPARAAPAPAAKEDARAAVERIERIRRAR
jgi:hypothetical protein